MKDEDDDDLCTHIQADEVDKGDDRQRGHTLASSQDCVILLFPLRPPSYWFSLNIY